MGRTTAFPKPPAPAHDNAPLNGMRRGNNAPTSPRPHPQDEAGGASYALAYRDEK